MNNVWAYIGSFNGGSGSQPGVYPINSPVTNANFNTDFPHLAGTITAVDYGDPTRFLALEHEAGTTTDASDASRYLGTLAAGECRTVYWLISYPRVATVNGSRVDVTGGVKPDDDLWLQYDFWGKADSVSPVYYTRYVTMRNEISAMANKIWPNGDNKVPDEYVSAIQQALGWDTWTPNGTGTTAYPGETVTSQGIWYDLGNVGAGFDNNYDFVPDRNVWVQPIGDASSYDPGCFRLVKTYGLVIVKLNDGTELLIPFVDQMYFDNIPDNNNGAVGLVFYEYTALDGACTAGLTPYQEVASGYDNEKFNADFGAGIPPLQSQETDMAFDKTDAPTAVNPNAQITYTLSYTNIDPDGAGGMTVTVGNPGAGTPFTIEDKVPAGTCYVSGSAAGVAPTYPNNLLVNGVQTPSAYQVLYSTDTDPSDGIVWQATEPGDTAPADGCNDTTYIRWLRTDAVANASTGQVQFKVLVPSNYIASTGNVTVENTGCLKLGEGPCFKEDKTTTIVTGNGSINGTVWKDDSVTGGVLANGVQDGTEAGIPSVTVKLYWDANGDGDYTDAGDFLYGTTTSMNYLIQDGYVDVDRNGIINSSDSVTGLAGGVNIINGQVDLNGDGAITSADVGFFGGYPVGPGTSYGLIDVNGGGISTTDDGTLIGVYNFGRLPATDTTNPKYILVVDPADSDIPTGYGPTTTIEYKNIEIGTTSTTQNYGDGVTELSDFGFAPPLSLDKNLATATAVVVGDTVQYNILLRNHMPGDGSGSSACVYKSWSPTEGSLSTSQPANKRFANTLTQSPPNPTYAFNSIGFDSVYAVSDFSTGANQVLSSVNYTFGPQTSSITNVKMRVRYYVSQTVVDDYAHIAYYVGATPALNSPISTLTYTTAELNAHVGFDNSGYLEWNLGATNPATGAAWQWSELGLGNTIQILFGLDKNGSADTALMFVDGLVMEVTSDGACGGSSTTLNPVPLTDTFNSAYYSFVSSNPPVSSSSAGTLTWSNVGPIYPGETKIVTVNLRALQSGTSPQTINTATSTGAKFANGLPANSPVTDTASVTIGANTATRSLSGKVFDDNATTGWLTGVWSEPGTAQSGYNASDIGIPYIPVDLYACMDVTGVPVINAQNNRTCATSGGTWQYLQTVSTDVNGNYSFTGLRQGYYYVKIHNEYIVGTQTADVDQTAIGNCTTCDSQSNSGTNLQTNPFPGDLNNNTAITNVNFGYNVPAGTYNIGDFLFYDWNGNGTRDAIDEPMSGITIQLLGPDGTVIATTTTDTNGNYLFTGYPVGYYTVRVASSSLPSGVTQTYDPDNTKDGRSTFTLTANDLTRDFAYQPVGSGEIGDTVFKDINGDGTQGNTEPGIPGVTVQLQVDLNGDGNYVTIKTAATDSNGNYLFTGLPAGTYRVVVDTSTNSSAIPNDMYGNDYKPSPVSGTTVSGSSYYSTKTLATNTATDYTADFGFMPPASIGDTVYWDTNSNGTQDTGEPGIQYARVYLYTFTDDGDRRYEPGEALSGSPVATAYTDANGKYYFTGLTPNQNYVVVVDTGNTSYDPGTGSTVNNPVYNRTLTADPSADGVATNCASIDTGNALCDARDGMRLFPGTSYMGADFGFRPVGSFGDTLWIDSNNNGIVDAGESGISGVDVRLYSYTDTNGNGVYDPGTDALGSQVGSTKTTDLDGKYYFTGVNDGNYALVVDTADLPSGLVNTYNPDASNDSITSVNIASGAVSRVGTCTASTGCTGEDNSDPLYLDADFGYRFVGTTDLSGTICLETTVDGVCGTDTTDISGVGTGETAYNNVTVYLYRLVDNPGGVTGQYDPGIDDVVLAGVTSSNASGDYSFADVADGVYYIIAIGAPQSGLDLTSSQGTVNSGGDDTATTQYVETTAANGTTLSTYQVVNTAGDTTVTDRDFAFQLSGSYDFGDLPASYSTALSGTPDGARHAVPSTPVLYFGAPGATQASLVDANGTPTVDATGDGSDEDGVFINTTLAENADGWSDGVGVMTFNIVGSGWLVAWMDFDGDGQFSDANEMVINQAVTSGQGQTITITTPTSFTGTNIAGSNYLYSRFRLFPSPPALAALAYSGVASSGEVEDYRFPIPSSGVVTPITLSYFHAQRQGSSIKFEWSTLTETANLGFNLYVKSGNGDLIQINKELIPSKTTDSLTRQDYTYSLNVGGNTFYIEDISVIGEVEKHGPFQLGRKYGGITQEEKVDQSAINAEHQKKMGEQQAKLKNNLRIPSSALSAPVLRSVPSARYLLDTTLNFKVDQTGIYRVTYEQLTSAGLNLRNVPITKITLTNQGRIVPVFVQNSSDKKLNGKFGPGAYIEFYGEALDTTYTDTNVYTLQVTATPSLRIPGTSSAPNLKLAPATFYMDTATVNNQRAYANYAPGDDAWYDTAMLVSSPKSWSFPFQISGLANSSSPQTFQLVVWGATDYPNLDPDHHLLVSVNGTPVADEYFDGLVEHVIEVTLPAGTLREGENIIELTLPNDTGEKYDLINLDKFSVTYPRTFKAQDGKLTFTDAGKAFTVTNLPDRNVVVYRLDSKGVTRLNNVKVTTAGSTFSASFAGTGAVATYIVTSVTALSSPTLEVTRAKVSLDQPAQYLIIAHPDFIEGLAPLVQARKAQGLTVSVVDVNDLYMQYSYGVFDPSAIKQYIAYAEQKLGTEYVLLVGGDTYDYRNYLGINSMSFIPSLYMTTDPTSKFVPVDPLYADVDDDNIPDVSIGRFPVRSRADLDLIIAKTLDYADKDYGRTAVFASDRYDNIVSYKALSNSVAATLPAGWTIQSIHMDDMSVAAAQQQLISAMNNGAALITYTGHSAPTTWSFSRLFMAPQAQTLTNAGRPFVAVQWGCFNTYYVEPANNTLVQNLLFAGDRGAVAIMGASTRTDSESEELLGLLLTPRLSTPGTSVGAAMLDAKRQLANEHPELLDVILGWTLMGDPALVIEP